MLSVCLSVQDFDTDLVSEYKEEQEEEEKGGWERVAIEEERYATTWTLFGVVPTRVGTLTRWMFTYC